MAPERPLAVSSAMQRFLESSKAIELSRKAEDEARQFSRQKEDDEIEMSSKQSLAQMEDEKQLKFQEQSCIWKRRSDGMQARHQAEIEALRAKHANEEKLKRAENQKIVRDIYTKFQNREVDLDQDLALRRKQIIEARDFLDAKKDSKRAAEDQERSAEWLKRVKEEVVDTDMRDTIEVAVTVGGSALNSAETHFPKQTTSTSIQQRWGNAFNRKLVISFKLAPDALQRLDSSPSSWPPSSFFEHFVTSDESSSSQTQSESSSIVRDCCSATPIEERDQQPSLDESKAKACPATPRSSSPFVLFPSSASVSADTGPVEKLESDTQPAPRLNIDDTSEDELRDVIVKIQKIAPVSYLGARNALSKCRGSVDDSIVLLAKEMTRGKSGALMLAPSKYAFIHKRIGDIYEILNEEELFFTSPRREVKGGWKENRGR
ncbi:hypothetical protein B0J14DRAFT_633967 [Halenospora varia]|nr:hypothetical protein B0J14DRAFT_633967 [Halenospora varia]